eukprot:gene7065-23459_t
MGARLLVAVLLGPARSAADTAITRFNITFTFKGDVRNGLYATGDFWIV